MLLRRFESLFQRTDTVKRLTTRQEILKRLLSEMRKRARWMKRRRAYTFFFRCKHCLIQLMSKFQDIAKEFQLVNFSWFIFPKQAITVLNYTFFLLIG